MELFDVLPERFFGLLAGKCRRIYAEAGLCLYEQYRLAQFGIEQEILRDKFQELIESWAEAGVAYEDDVFSEKDNAIEESRAKAANCKFNCRKVSLNFYRVISSQHTYHLLTYIRKSCADSC